MILTGKQMMLNLCKVCFIQVIIMGKALVVTKQTMLDLVSERLPMDHMLEAVPMNL